MPPKTKKTLGGGAAHTERETGDEERRSVGDGSSGRGRSRDLYHGQNEQDVVTGTREGDVAVRYTLSSDGACASVVLPKQASGTEYTLAGYAGDDGYRGIDGSAIVALSKNGEAQELRAYGRKAIENPRSVRVTYVYIAGEATGHSSAEMRHMQVSEREGKLIEMGTNTVTLIDKNHVRWVIRNYTEIKYLDRDTSYLNRDIVNDEKEEGDVTDEDASLATIYAVQFPKALEAGTRLSWPVSKITWLPLIAFATVPNTGSHNSISVSSSSFSISKPNGDGSGGRNGDGRGGGNGDGGNGDGRGGGNGDGRGGGNGDGRGGGNGDGRGGGNGDGRGGGNGDGRGGGNGETLLRATITLQAVVTNEGKTRSGTFQLTTEPTRRATTMRYGGIPVGARRQTESKRSRAPMASEAAAAAFGSGEDSSRDAESRVAQQEKLTYELSISALKATSQHKLHLQTFFDVVYTKHYSTEVGADGDGVGDGDTTDAESGEQSTGGSSEVLAQVQFRVAAPLPTSKMVFLDSLGKEFASGTTVAYTPAKQIITASLGTSKVVNARHEVWLGPISDPNTREVLAASGTARGQERKIQVATVTALPRTRVIRVTSTIENTNTDRSSTLKVRYAPPYRWSTDVKTWKFDVSEPTGARVLSASKSGRNEHKTREDADTDVSEESNDESSTGSRAPVTSTYSHVYVKHDILPTVVPFQTSSSNGFTIVLKPQQRITVTWTMPATENH